MSQTYKQFKNLMKVEEIRGQRILTSFYPPDDNTRVEVFAKNLPQNLDEDVIIPFFEKVGAIHTFRLMLDKNNASNRGFAYLTYLRSEDATTAIRVLNGKEMFKNHPIQVTQSLNNCRIFLGGIPVKKTKDEVWQELSKRGIINIVDVIMYRSYNNRAENRGFVFVEFPSHQFAAKMRNRMMNMILWNNEVIVDWSVPEPVVSQEEMMKVKILYIRNLDVMESRECLKAIVESYLNPELILKVYKFKNYAFIHLATREAAWALLTYLRKHFKNTAIEVSFAKPVSEYTKPEYRKRALSKTSHAYQHQDQNFIQKCLNKTEEHTTIRNSILEMELRNLRQKQPFDILPMDINFDKRNEMRLIDLFNSLKIDTSSKEEEKKPIEPIGYFKRDMHDNIHGANTPEFFDSFSPTFSKPPKQQSEIQKFHDPESEISKYEQLYSLKLGMDKFNNEHSKITDIWPTYPCSLRKCSQDNGIGLAQTVNQLGSTPSYQTLLIPKERKSTNSPEISKTSELFSTYSTSHRQNEERKETNEWKNHTFFKEGEFEWPVISKSWMPVESEITLQDDDDIYNTFSKDR